MSGCGGGGGGGPIGLSTFETERHQYAQDNLLQSYDVYVPDHGSDSDEAGSMNDKYWVM